MKIDLAYDLLTDSIVSHGLQGATKQDKTIGKEFVIEVRRGDLVLRDMGDFSLSESTVIEELEAWWLTRLPLITGTVLADGRTLEKLLRSFQADIIDIEAIVGKRDKKCRLVALRAGPKVSAARRPEHLKEARDCGKNPCPKRLFHDGWHLMLTHLSREQTDVSQLGMRIAQRIGNTVGRARLSYEKLYDLLAVRRIKARDLSELDAFDPDPSHLGRDKRTRKSPVGSSILALIWRECLASFFPWRFNSIPHVRGTGLLS